MPSPIRQDHARWKRLKPLQIHLNPLLKGLNLFTTFHLPGRGITSPFHTIYIYIYIRTCTCKQQWISKTNQFLLVGHSGMIFSKKNTERSPNHLSKTRQKTNVFPSFFLEHQKNLGSRKGPWRDLRWESMDPNPWLLVHLFEFQPTGRVSHHAEKISFDRSIHDPGGGKKWWLISAAWTAAVGILGFCKRGFWVK